MTRADLLATEAVSKRARAYDLRLQGRTEEANSLDVSASILLRAAEHMARCAGPRHGDDRSLAHIHGSAGIDRAAGAELERAEPEFNTACNPDESTILAAIRARNRTNSITAQDLGALIHRDPRAIRAIVSHLRAEHGECICSAAAHRRDEPAGYYYPARPEDADSTLAQLESRRVEIEAAVTGMRQGLRRAFGSLPLFGD